MKVEGNAQWIVYVVAGLESRRASILSVSAKARTAHFEAFGEVSDRPARYILLATPHSQVYGA